MSTAKSKTNVMGEKEFSWFYPASTTLAEIKGRGHNILVMSRGILNNTLFFLVLLPQK